MRTANCGLGFLLGTLALLSATEVAANCFLYWTSEAVADTIWRARTDGTDVVDLFQGTTPEPGGIDLDAAGGHIYWTSYSSTGSIHRADLDAGNPVTLVTDASPGPTPVRVDTIHGHIYWIHNLLGDYRIRRADLDGSNVTDLIVGIDEPVGLDIDPARDHIYWSELPYTFSGTIRRADLDGTNIVDLIPDLPQARDLEVDFAAGHLYWMEWDGEFSAIRRANLDGDDIVDLVTGLPSSEVLALDTTKGHMYWSETESNDILRANLDGTDVVTLLAGVDRKGWIAVDVPAGDDLDCDGIRVDTTTDLLFDNGAPDLAGLTASEYPWEVADDVVLAPGSNVVSRVAWWGSYGSANTPPVLDDFHIRFYADDGGSPAVSSFSDVSVGWAVTRVDTGDDLASYGYDVYAYTATFDPVDLPANTTIWMSIQNDTSLDLDDIWYWDTSSATGNNHFRTGSGSAWLGNARESGFQLLGLVPNPCTGGETLGCDDNCPSVSNADQADEDADGIGDACESVPIPALGLAAQAFLGVSVLALGLLAARRRE